LWSKSKNIWEWKPFPW